MNTTTNIKVSTAFENSIKRLGFDFDDVVNNWIYDPTKSKDDSKTTHCICGQRIKLLHVIQSPDKKNRLIIGKDCAEKFMITYTKEYTGKRCDKCNEPHKNTKNNICSACRLVNSRPPSKLLEQIALGSVEIEPIKCPNYDICHAMVKHPFKVCYTCNKPNLKEKTIQCQCGTKIESKYRKCFKCRFLTIENLGECSM